MRNKASLYLIVIFLMFLSGCEKAGNNDPGNDPTENPSVVADAANISTDTNCAEEDNVNIPITGSVTSFRIEATHPVYEIQQDNCAADFTGCPDPEPGYAFTPGVIKMFDDGETVVEAVTEIQWWLPEGMDASVNDGEKQTDIHYIRIYRKIAGANEWPQIMVLYMDGNMRLIPHPPEGKSSVCFGSSVIVGPAASAARPYVEIESVNYNSASKQIEIKYATGGKAIALITEINRQALKITVTVEYATDQPFVTFRSMFVESGNTDVDTVDWVDQAGTQHSSGIMEFAGSQAVQWFFHRTQTSVHNTSAPDIRILLN